MVAKEEIAPDSIFERMDLTEAERRFAAWKIATPYATARDELRIEFQDRWLWVVREELRATAREMSARDENTPTSELWRYRDLATATSGTPIHRLRPLMVSLLMRGNMPRGASARWVSEASVSDLKQLVSTMEGYRTVIEVFREDFERRNQARVGAWRSDLRRELGAMPAATNGSKVDQGSRELRPRDELNQHAGHRGGGIGAGDRAREPDNLTPTDRAGNVRLLLLARDCSPEWRGKLAMPFGEFSAVLTGEFVDTNTFNARGLDFNEAAVSVLDSKTNGHRSVTIFYGCQATTVRTALVEQPMEATVTSANDNVPCSRRRSTRTPFMPSKICFSEWEGAPGYEVRSAIRAGAR